MKYIKLFESSFNPPSTPASLNTEDPVEALDFYEGQYRAVSDRMADIMMRQGYRISPSTQDYTNELSDYIDQYERAIRYTKRFIREGRG
jgi:hypothetical protein